MNIIVFRVTSQISGHKNQQLRKVSCENANVLVINGEKYERVKLT
jgi:hypothetical protein